MGEKSKYYRKVPWRAEPMVLVTKLSHSLQMPDWSVIGLLEWLWMFKEQNGDQIARDELMLHIGGPTSPLAHGSGMVDGVGLDACWEQLVNHGILTPNESGGAAIKDWRE